MTKRSRGVLLHTAAVTLTLGDASLDRTQPLRPSLVRLTSASCDGTQVFFDHLANCRDGRERNMVVTY
ncbi:hypothetical protein E2C01_096289 [Portunus trituberculatus]|uniref:Secreted protein n=1 Tax=Portunus trituberculatus TaxID=210409 RepID=A0A5B7K1C6_PORTR|nr:hypothetical protein [Portunus trituberculatus]